MATRRYAILGTGAVGGYYGARLAHAGCDVRFLLHRDYAHVRRRGLTVESVDGDFSLAEPNAYCDATEMPRCDVVVVALKTTQNHLLPELLPPVVAADGVVLVLQNGYGVEQRVAEIVGPDRVMGGLCFLCSNKVGPGHIRQLDYGRIQLGEYSPSDEPRGITARMRRIAADFERAGIAITMDEDLLAARWKKLVWNVPFNGLCVLLDTTTDRLMADDDTRALCESLMREVAAGAAEMNRAIDDAFLEKMLDHTAKMTPYRPSMKIDYDERRPMEVEAIYGAPLRAVTPAGVELPRMQSLCGQLRFLDRRNRGEV